MQKPALSDTEARDWIATLSAEGERHDIVSGGVRLAWRRFGAGGTPLVLLHGGHGSWLHWARNIRTLAVDRELWLPDLPGYGDSDPPSGSLLPALLAPLRAGLDRLVGPRTPIDLVGFSFGGLVAAYLAAQRPAVRRLALLGPAGHGGERRPRGELLNWRSAARQQDAAALASAMRHNLCMHMLHGPAAIDAVALRLHTDACMRTRFHSKAISRSGGLTDSLQHQRGPLLLIWGEHDVTALPCQAAELIGAVVPQREVHIIPRAGHWVQYEAAAAINARLQAWLDGDAPPQAAPAITKRK